MSSKRLEEAAADLAAWEKQRKAIDATWRARLWGEESAKTVTSPNTSLGTLIGNFFSTYEEPLNSYITELRSIPTNKKRKSQADKLEELLGALRKLDHPDEEIFDKCDGSEFLGLLGAAHDAGSDYYSKKYPSTLEEAERAAEKLIEAIFPQGIRYTF